MEEVKGRNQDENTLQGILKKNFTKSSKNYNIDKYNFI